MEEKTVPWFLYLTLVNDRTQDAVDAVYPCSKFRMLENLNRCRVPYGAGSYHHIAGAMDGFGGDSLQAALASAIENASAPPSIWELNRLAELLQGMRAEQRRLFQQAAASLTSATVKETLQLAYRLSGESLRGDEEGLKERTVLWEENDPYFRVFFVHDGERWFEDENGVWVGFPATENDFHAAAAVMGVKSLNELRENRAEGIVKCGSTLTLTDINRWAAVLKEYRIGEQLGKYKAILDFEDCVDLEEAIQLAKSMDEYEFFPDSDFVEILDRYQEGASLFDYDEQMEAADEWGISMTEYGIVKKISHTEKFDMTLQG